MMRDDEERRSRIRLLLVTPTSAEGIMLSHRPRNESTDIAITSPNIVAMVPMYRHALLPLGRVSLPTAPTDLASTEVLLSDRRPISAVPTRLSPLRTDVNDPDGFVRDTAAGVSSRAHSPYRSNRNRTRGRLSWTACAGRSARGP